MCTLQKCVCLFILIVGHKPPPPPPHPGHLPLHKILKFACEDFCPPNILWAGPMHPNKCQSVESSSGTAQGSFQQILKSPKTLSSYHEKQRCFYNCYFGQNKGFEGKCSQGNFSKNKGGGWWGGGGGDTSCKSLRIRLRICLVISVNYHYITVLCPFNLLIHIKCYNTV